MHVVLKAGLRSGSADAMPTAAVDNDASAPAAANNWRNENLNM